MFRFQKRGGTTTASGLESGGDASGEGDTMNDASPSDALTMPVDDTAHDDQAYAESADYAASSAPIRAESYNGPQGSNEHDVEQQDQAQGDVKYGGDYASAQHDPSAVDASNDFHHSQASAHDADFDPHQREAEHEQQEQYPPHSSGGGGGDGGDGVLGGEEGEGEAEEGQLFTDYHGGSDHMEARSRRLQQQKMYDDIPVPPDDADPRTVFAYYRKLIGLVQLVPPKHWREIRFDLPASVAELRLYPQRRERVQDREPVRPSSTVVISLEGMLPEGMTPSEYAAQMVQYFFDLLQYQNASSAITALRFVKRGTELSQMVVTLGRDVRLAGRVLTELQAAGLRAHYGMIIFEHPPNATFQVVDYRRTLHDGKGISAEDLAFLLEPMRQTKTVDINVIEGYEPGVFYVPVKRPEAVYAFLWNFFCSYKFQADLFRRYGVLVTQANCPHEFLKKGIPYHIQKKELEAKMKAELVQKGFEGREGAMDAAGGRVPGAAAAANDDKDDDDDDELDEETVANGEGPPPAWVTSAADEIDIFSGLTRSKAGRKADPLADALSRSSVAVTAASTTTAATTPSLVDAEEEIMDIDALLKQYHAGGESTKKKNEEVAGGARRGRGGAGDAANPAAVAAAPPPPPPPPIMDALPFNTGGAGYGWVDPRQQAQLPPPPPPPQQQQQQQPYSTGPGFNGGGGGGYHDDLYGGSYGQNSSYPPYAGGPGTYPTPPPPLQQQQSYYFPQPPAPASVHSSVYGGGYPGSDGRPTPFGELSSGNGAGAPPPPPPPATSYPPLVESEEDEETSYLPSKEQQPHTASSGNVNMTDASRGNSAVAQQQQQQQASPYEKEGLLSWSMDETTSPARGGGGWANQLDSREVWSSSGSYNPLQQLQQQGHIEGHSSFLSPSPAPAGGEAEDNEDNGHDNNNNNNNHGGGAGILGDYDPSLDAPFYSGENNVGDGGYAAAPQQQQQQGWGIQDPMIMAMNNSSSNNSGDYGYAQGWGSRDGFFPSQGASTSFDSYHYTTQQQQMTMMYTPPPPHVCEAAQLAEDLEERVQAAFPLSWRAATSVDAPPFPLDGEPQLDDVEAAATQNGPNCVLHHVAVSVAAQELPAPSTEMEELFQFLHRHVSLIGRLLHKTTTTTVEQANDVAPFRARVARALLIGATSQTDAATWASAWTPQRADGHLTTSDPVLPATEADTRDALTREKDATMSSTQGGEDKKGAVGEAGEEEAKQTVGGATAPAAAAAAAAAETATTEAGEPEQQQQQQQQQEQEEEEVMVEYQLPALLPYLLRMPAGVDLAMLLALHYPCAFARRFLPYAPAFLMEEHVVRMVLATALRHDPRAAAPLVRDLLAHWCPLLQWLKDFVEAKAQGGSAGEKPATSTSAPSVSASAVVKQLVSLLGNTMDVVLSGLSCEQREACFACSKTHDYVNAFVAALEESATPEASTESGEGEEMAQLLPQLWGPDGALYRSLLRLYMAADAIDAASLARRVLLRSASPDVTDAPRVCLHRDHFYYCLTVLSPSQTAPALSREAAAFCGVFLQLMELQQTQASRRQNTPGGAEGDEDDTKKKNSQPNANESDARQLLDTAFKSLQTSEAYTALRDAYLDLSGPITRYEAVLAQLSSATPTAAATLYGTTYREWYVNTNQQQKRAAEAAKVSSIFYYQPPSRRNANNHGGVSGSGNARWSRNPQFPSRPHNSQWNSEGNGGESWAQPQQPVWVSAAGQWAGPATPGDGGNQNSNNNNNNSSGGGVLGQRGSAVRSFSTAAQQWRAEWTELMRSYPPTGTPFEGTLPEGWTSGLNRSLGRYFFTKATHAETNAAERAESSTTTTTGAGEAQETPSTATTQPTTATQPSTAAETAVAPATPTYKHPGDNKEYLATPQAFLKELGAAVEATAIQIGERANVMHREEAVTSGLPPPAELTQRDVETWLSDQRHRNVFLDVATTELLGICYRSHTTPLRNPAAAAAGAMKRGRDAYAAQVKTLAMTVDEQQALLAKLIPSSYPAIGVPYPALFPGWSVYYNSARGQFGFAGPHHGTSQPPLFIHPKTRKHYFISPQSFVRQRKINYDVIAQAAEVSKAAVETWMADQRTRQPAIDAAVIKIVPINYSDVERSLSDNAAATAAAAADESEEKKESAGPNASTARQRERSAVTAITSGAGEAAPPSPSTRSNTNAPAGRRRSDRAGGHNSNNASSREERRNRRSRSSSSDGGGSRGGSRRLQRRRRRGGDADSYDDSYSYRSDDWSDDNDGYGGGRRRRRRARKDRSPRRRGGGGNNSSRGGRRRR